MKWWLIHIPGLLLSWHVMDLESKQVLDGVIATLLFGYFLIAVFVKLVMITNARGSGAGVGGIDGGGDCGGGGGGDGGC